MRGTRVFVPTDTSDFQHRILYPTGNGETVPLGGSREWSGVAKLDNHSFQGWNLGYQAILNHIEGQRTNYAFRLNPDGEPSQRTFSLVHGLDVNHAMGKNSYFSATFRQNYFDYRDMAYDDPHDPHYALDGPPIGHPSFAFEAPVMGVDFGRFRRSTIHSFSTGSTRRKWDARSRPSARSSRGSPRRSSRVPSPRYVACAPSA